MDTEKLQAEIDKDLEMLRARDFWGALVLICCALFFSGAPASFRF